MVITDAQRKAIAEQARNELSRRNYKDYVVDVHHGAYQHFPHTELVCDYLQRIAEGEQMHLMIEMPPRHGKLCADSTPVYTPKGWTTHGQLKVGDCVYHVSGKPIQILWTSAKASADWIVELSNGDSVRVHGNHEWTIYDRATKQYRTVETKWFRRETNFNKVNPIKTSDNRCKYQLPNIAPLVYDHKGLSVDGRLNVLRDLIQSHAVIDKTGRTRYTTSDKALHDKIYHIALTLGFRPYTTTVERNRDNTRLYQVCFNPTIPLTDEQRTIKQKRIGIVDVRYEPNGEVGHCIQVDSDDGLYLAGKTLIPTHNSMTVTETFPSYYLGRNPDKRVITSAYSDGLARKFGRLNRNKFGEYAHRIFNQMLSYDNSSTSEWGVANRRGGMISTGIGGSITGQGADCFVAGTMIDTEIGKVDIKQLHEMVDKPRVLSYNHKRKKQEYKRIVASREVNKKSHHMTIETREGNIVTCTPDHPFYIKDNGYVPICKAKMSGKFLTSDNTYDTSIDFDIYPCDNAMFYDIQVEDNHNFYASNLLVHNCMIIDDPIKNAKEAQSTTIRENIWNEWESTLSTRLHKGASVIVIMTRWHEDDLIGRLLDNSPYDWKRLRLPAIAEDDDDLLGRDEGQALCPELGYDERWAELKKQEVGSRTWASLYQQRPSPEQGSIFKREWLQFVDNAPSRYDDILISWDMTFKDSNSSDYVVGQVWQKVQANYYLIDMVRGQMDFTQSMQAVVNLKNKYPRCRRILIEDKANGPAIINTLKNRINGIIPITPRESKEARAYAVTPLYEAGNVYFKNGVYQLHDLVEELVAFPNSSHDDTVDAMTQALNYFMNQPQASVSSANVW